ncbi:MAG: ChrR family anti-sigma-E factor [Hyphomicrobiaceae bacterium]
MIRHHPTDETLAAYVRNALDEGRHVVVAAHIEHCPSCARMMTAADNLLGLTLEDAEPAPLRRDALTKVLRRIDQRAAGEGLFRHPTAKPPPGIGALAGYELGPWRWIGPGVRRRSVSVPRHHGARVFMLKAAPCTSLPHHTHTGTELTLVLQGAFAHAGGRFGVGDFEEADGTVEHRPVVEAGEDCLCLVAMQGQLRLLGRIGRILQPFVRM